ncbi:MAG: lysine--tRNA ligase [Patescibacteria group bacterium]|nr:MAG: lysine--tRNA ligase [Patescibacteria group bacterium]
MATLSELRQIRIDKLNKLRELGIDPYPAVSNKSHPNITFHENYEELEGKEVTAAGRIISIRKHGKLAFIDIKDATGKIQLYIKEAALLNPNYQNSEIGFADLGLLDNGDFAEGKGILTKTQSGEISVEVTSIRILTKSLRPLPDAWDGLKDKETRLRRRYIDTNLNPEVFQRFIRRSKFWEAHRDFFKEHGFLEMNIPVLETTPGGADANPFVTHMDVLDQDFYLRISQELYLKRLIGGGYEKVYEIGPRFRNEGISDEHLPEHIAMEFYWAYADWNAGMKFIKDLFRYVTTKVYGTTKFSMKGFEVDFGNEWEIIDYSEILKKRFDIDIFDNDFGKLKKVLEKNHIEVNKHMNFSRGVDALWKLARKDIAGPAFVINEPKFLSPLAKSDPNNPEVAMRFHPIAAGGELGNGFSELNDPIDQYERFKEQQALRDSGDTEAQFLDIDFVEMLEYGMPPTLGYGHSERVFWFLENVPAREGVPFPQLKHELDSVTKKIYGIK